MTADATTITTGITTGRYARVILTGEAAFVTDFKWTPGIAQIRRMDGTKHWVTPTALAPVTDDENIAAAYEWMIATGQAAVITGGADLDALLG
jgi:hypothetical protein